MAILDISARLAQINKRLSRRKKQKKAVNSVKLTKAEFYQKQLRTVEAIRARPTELETAIENLQSRIVDCDRSIKYHEQQIQRIREHKAAHQKHLADYIRIRDNFDTEHSRLKSQYENEKSAEVVEKLNAVSATMLELQNLMKANGLTMDDLKNF